MRNERNPPSNNDVLDIRIRFFRRESPMLFRAFEEFSGRPGDRSRNGFIRQLLEMGLVVQEERMRRQDGLSTRIAGGFVPDLMGSTAAGPSSNPAPQQPVATPATPRITEAAPVAQAPVAEVRAAERAPGADPARTAQAGTAPASSMTVRDDDRPPPRPAGAKNLRMLDGETFE